MAGLNKVQLIGRLGADPEVRTMQSGGKVVNMRIATSESWRDKQTGDRVEKTEWHTVVVFNENLGKIAEQYLRKGSNVYIEGQLQTRKWQDQGGNDRYSTEVVVKNFRGEIVLLERNRDDDAPREERREERHEEPTEQPSYAEELDDEIPF